MNGKVKLFIRLRAMWSVWKSDGVIFNMKLYGPLDIRGGFNNFNMYATDIKERPHPVFHTPQNID